MMYRVGFPLWRLFIKLGCTAHVHVRTIWDQDAKVYVADSPDLKGLVAEAPDLDTLRTEVQSSIDALLSLQLRALNNIRANPVYREIGFASTSLWTNTSTK
jgi:hypothetical protein